MAENFSQYAFDPYQAEEEDIAALQLRMLQQALRGRTRNRGQVVNGRIFGADRPGDAFRKAQELREAEEVLNQGIPARRRALAERVQSELNTAIEGAGADPQTSSLLKSPLTRALGMKELGAEKERDRQGRDFEVLVRTIKGLRGQSGSPTPSGTESNPFPEAQGLTHEQMLALANHPNPRISSYYKEAVKFYYPDKMEPGKVYPQQGGGYRGSREALDAHAAMKKAEEEQKAAFDIHQGMVGGVPVQTTRLQAAQRLGGYPVLPAYPPTGPTPSGPSSSPVAGPSPVPSGPPPAAPPSGPGLQIPPEILAADARGQPFQATQAPGGPVEFQQGGPEADVPPIFGRPPQLGQAPAQFGVGISEGTKASQVKRAELEEKTLAEERALLKSSVAAIQTGKLMSELNQKGHIINGPLPRLKTGLERAGRQILGMEIPESISSSEFYDKLNLTQLRDSLKAFGSGTGISNLDLIVAQRTLPGRELTPEGRQQIIDYMLGQAQSDVKNLLFAEKYKAKWGTLAGFERQAFDKDGNLIPQEEMQRRMMEIQLEKKGQGKQALFQKALAVEAEKNKPSSFQRYKDAMGDVARSVADIPGNPERTAEVLGYALLPAGGVGAAGLATRAALPKAVQQVVRTRSKVPGTKGLYRTTDEALEEVAKPGSPLAKSIRSAGRYGLVGYGIHELINLIHPESAYYNRR